MIRETVGSAKEKSRLIGRGSASNSDSSIYCSNMGSSESSSSSNNGAHPTRLFNAAFVKKIKSILWYTGPGFLIAVGYVDPGNWATDLVAGSKYNYSLLCVIFLSNIMAVVLQGLCARLGMVTGKDLAQHCRDEFSASLSLVLYILAECAMIATDVSEVIGTALALQLLFGMPIIYGVLLTALDTIILLVFWGSKTVKAFEITTCLLVALVGGCFAVLLAAIGPDWTQVALGFVPDVSILGNSDKLYLAVSILGATIMPHNLYLHSYLVQFHRKPPPVSLDSSPETTKMQIGFVRDQLRYSMYDLLFALTIAMAINGAILVLAAAAFYKRGLHNVADLNDAHALLNEFIGPVWGGGLFALALLLSSNSSTITGTLTGQIVMEGFWNWTISPVWRRLVTRLVAMVPAIIAAVIMGERGVNDLLIATQAVLSIQLPFAAWPLVYFTSSKRIMRYSYSKPVDANSERATLGDGAEYFPESLNAVDESNYPPQEARNGVSLDVGSGASPPPIVLETPSISTPQEIAPNKLTELYIYSWQSNRDFASGWWLTSAACLSALVISLLNVVMLYQLVFEPSD